MFHQGVDVGAASCSTKLCSRSRLQRPHDCSLHTTGQVDDDHVPAQHGCPAACTPRHANCAPHAVSTAPTPSPRHIVSAAPTQSPNDPAPILLPHTTWSHEQSGCLQTKPKIRHFCFHNSRHTFGLVDSYLGVCRSPRPTKLGMQPCKMNSTCSSATAPGLWLIDHRAHASSPGNGSSSISFGQMDHSSGTRQDGWCTASSSSPVLTSGRHSPRCQAGHHQNGPHHLTSSTS